MLDDEPQLLAADAVVFGRIVLDQRLALFVREVARESRAHVLQPLRPRDEGLVKLPQQFRLGGTLHRIVADNAAHGTDRQPVAAGDQQRNALAVVDHII